MTRPRLASLPAVALTLPGPPARRARGYRARLLGLAALRVPPPEPLLLPRTRSVHTVGMRFALDLVWLDGRGCAVRIDRDVPPARVRSCGGACAVLEVPAATALGIDGLRPGNRILAT